MSEIVLYQPPTRPWGTPNMSPFCAKLETYLRITETPYKQATKFARGPKNKVPWIELDGAALGDSQLIIEELERRRVAAGKPALDGDLSPRDRAIARAVRRSLEEGLYFVGLYMRWRPDDGYAATRAEFKKFVPGIALPFVRRMQLKKLYEQGTGRHTYDEVGAMGVADIAAVADLLGDRPFLLGDAPHVVDCTAFGFLEATGGFPVETPVNKAIRGHANLMAYRKRIRERWWKDLPEAAF